MSVGPLPNSTRLCSSSHVLRPSPQTLARQLNGPLRSDSRTTPEDCARVMLHAIEARSPKPRYGVTPLARLVKFGKRFLTDKGMDAILRSKYGITRDL